MKQNDLIQNKKTLNSINSINNNSMKRGLSSSKLNEQELRKSIKEAQKDPNFIRELNKFIKAATTVHKLC